MELERLLELAAAVLNRTEEGGPGLLLLCVKKAKREE